MNIGYGRKVLRDNASVSVSSSKSNMNSNGTSYQNGLFVNVDEVHNNTKNMTLSGFNQEGGTVTGNIENLTIESKQNTSITKGRTVGGSLSIAPNGMPSGSANYSQTNGERKVVDSPTTFLIGDGSNLKVGKVENTAGAIGATGNGKLSIDEYVGHNLENVDKSKTVGGSVGVSASGITSLGVNYSDRKQEGITKNTVIGNVEIGKSSGDEINKDLDTMTEITEDRDFKTNINIESQTINYIKNPDKFKEDLGKAKDEINDVAYAIEKSIKDPGEDNRNAFEQLRETRFIGTFNNIAKEKLETLNTADEIADVTKMTLADMGYDDVDVIFSDPAHAPQLIDKNGKTKSGTAYVDKEKGEKVYIDWDLYEGNFSEAMHYSLYERLKNQISKYSYRYKINYWGFEAKTRVNDTNEINKDFKEIDNSEAVYHNYIPEINSINMEKNKINTKRVNYYTGQESVTDFNGKLVTDTWNIGTGNTFTYDPNKKNWANTRDKIYHGLVDIPNWVFLGTGIADKSTTWQRLRLFIMGAKVSGNYEELTDKGYNTVGEKELKDFYNRKQAEIEERKIKNTNLR